MRRSLGLRTISGRLSQCRPRGRLPPLASVCGYQQLPRGVRGVVGVQAPILWRICALLQNRRSEVRIRSGAFPQSRFCRGISGLWRTPSGGSSGGPSGNWLPPAPTSGNAFLDMQSIAVSPASAASQASAARISRSGLTSGAKGPSRWASPSSSRSRVRPASQSGPRAAAMPRSGSAAPSGPTCRAANRPLRQRRSGSSPPLLPPAGSSAAAVRLTAPLREDQRSGQAPTHC